jgi:xanthosine utilization system XapX-like protein
MKRSLIVWFWGTVVILGALLVFVATGWPGAPDGCLFDTPDSCYCEAFDPLQVLEGTAGVRQPVNTWSNLFAIASSFLVAYFVFRDRSSRGLSKSANPMRSDTLVPDLYVFVVLFLGLGSMWFHGSLTRWGGIIDNVSMYTYAAFPPAYSILRLSRSMTHFWLTYAPLVILFSLLTAFGAAPSAIGIAILIGIYLLVEVTIWVCRGTVMQGKKVTVLYWSAALISMLTAAVFWQLSLTGNSLCDPGSVLQLHGLVWHTLIGVMAVLLYFYWRAEDEDANMVAS